MKLDRADRAALGTIGALLGLGILGCCALLLLSAALGEAIHIVRVLGGI